VELYLKVVRGFKDVTYARYFYLGGGLAVSIGLILLNAVWGEPTVAVGSFQWCTWVSEDSDVNWYAYGLPKVIIYCFASILSILVCYQCVKVASSAGGGSFGKLWKSFNVLFLIIIHMLIYFPASLFVGYVYYANAMVSTLTASYTDWIGCQLLNFKGISSEDNSALMKTCGAHPETRVSMDFFLSQVFLVYLGSLYPLMITLNGDVKAVYWEYIVYFKLDALLNAIMEYKTSGMQVSCILVTTVLLVV
jgi:hypothetical protein